MGKIDSQSQSQPETTIQHFSHQHPLQLINHQPQPSLSFGGSIATCWCCRLQVSSGWVYSCMSCQYFLHIGCSQMPQQITHPCDSQNHVLFLLPHPIYPEGLFRCDACGNQGNGFSYHCGTCSIDLHTTCATMPLLVSHPSHHHQLNLIFSLPYNYINGTFRCGICQNLGSKQWLYRCNLCGFDAHPGCATATPTLAAHDHHHQQQQEAQYQVQRQYSAAPAVRSSIPINSNFVYPQRYQRVNAVGIPSTQNHGPMPNPMSSSSSFMGGSGCGVRRPTGRPKQNGTSNTNRFLQDLVIASTIGVAPSLVQGLLSGRVGGGGGAGDGSGGGSVDGADSGVSGVDLGGSAGWATDYSGGMEYY